MYSDSEEVEESFSDAFSVPEQEERCLEPLDHVHVSYLISQRISEFKKYNPEFAFIDICTILGPKGPRSIQGHRGPFTFLDDFLCLKAKELTEDIRYIIEIETLDKWDVFGHFKDLCYTKIYNRITDRLKETYSSITARDVISSKLILDLTIFK